MLFIYVMKYRMLNIAEVIEAGDEMCWLGEWMNVLKPDIGAPVLRTCYGLYRRKIS